MDIWQELGIAPTAEEREIKRAYARRLRIVHPEDDPEGFQRLREAYEIALRSSRFEHAEEPDAYAADTAGAEEGPHAAVTFPSAHQSRNDERAFADRPIPEAPRTSAFQPPELRHAPDDAEIAAEARDLAAEYLESVRVHPGSAAAELSAVLERPELESFVARERFEVELLAGLFEKNDLPLADVAAIADGLRWTEDPAHLYGIDGRMAAQVLARIQAHRDFSELEAAAQRGSVAAGILVSPFNPRSYRKAALRRSLVTEMRELLRTIQWVRPELVAYAVDARIIDWWSAKTSRANFYWSHLIFVLLFMLAAGAVFGPYDTPPVGFDCSSHEDRIGCEQVRMFFFLGLNALVGLGIARLYESAQLRLTPAWRDLLVRVSRSRIGPFLQAPLVKLGWIPLTLLLLILDRPVIALAPGSEGLLIGLTALAIVWLAWFGRASNFLLYAFIAMLAMPIGGIAAEPLMGGASFLAIATVALAILFVIFGKLLFPVLVEDKFGARALLVYRYGWLGVFAVLLAIVILASPERPVTMGATETALILVVVWSHLVTRYDAFRSNVYLGVLLTAFTFICGTVIVRLLGVKAWETAALLSGWIIGTAFHFAIHELQKRQ